jgi:uncharacterized protein (DUF1697 family)
MANQRYVALLRGINVGGKNKVSMSDLVHTFEGAGYSDVRTHIQSGNVLFRTDRERGSLEDHIERAIASHFEVPIVVVVRSLRQLRSVVRSAPEGFGERPDEYHSDAVFLKAPLTPATAMEVVQLRDGVDQVWAGNGVLYFARLSAKRTQSKMGKIIGTPQYASMTIRSWSTTTKLLDLLEADV